MHPGHSELEFKKIQDMLLEIARLKKKWKVNKPEIELIDVICSRNYQSTKNMIKLAIETGVGKVGFSHLDVFDDIEHLRLNEEQKIILKEEIKDSLALAKKHNITTNIPTFLAGINSEKTNTKYLYSRIPCYVGWTFARISIDGDIYPCCSCFGRLSLGNIKQSSFKQIWYSHKYDLFRNESKNIARMKNIATKCNCYSCQDYGRNLRIYNKLHFFNKMREL